MDGSWSITVTAAQPDSTVARPAAEVRAQGVRSASATAQAGDKKVYAEFEALMLQNLLDAAMPKSMESLFGKGAGGSLWRSKLLEQIGRSIAERGDFKLLGDVAGPQPRGDVVMQQSEPTK
ncbi:MAG: hypothetical protein ACR2PA_08990 [Hyphomicrobiaceae bacterium]